MNSFGNSSAVKGSFRFHVNFKSLETEDSDDWIIEGYATTPDVDRDNEIIEEKAVIDALNRYLTNPIILYQHDHNEPIGTVLSARYDSKGLKIRALISKTAHKVWTLIKEGILRAFSIAGLVIETLWDKVKKLTRITVMDVTEVSIVSVPANPETLFSAVDKAVKSFKRDINMNDESEQIDQLEKQENEVLAYIKKLDDKITKLEEKIAQPPEPKIEEVEEKTKSFTDDELELIIQKRLKEEMAEQPKRKALSSLATQEQIVEPIVEEKKSSLSIVKQMMLSNEGVDISELDGGEWWL